MTPSLLLGAALVLTASPATVADKSPKESPSEKPNIVFILCDDLGYGDVHCLNPQRGKIPTPNLDRLAAQGMTLTGAHSSASVCTPSRYSILTGRYNWRSKLQRGVLHDYASPLIPPERLTVAGFLRQQGYYTAAMGKWHLGWKWPKEGNVVDFTKPIEMGPTAVGFDYYFGAEGQGAPYCFIENDHTVGIPSVPLQKNHLGGDLDAGSDPEPKNQEPQSAPKTLDCARASVQGWKSENMLPTTTKRACDFIAERSKTGQPFFLYLAFPSPHIPLVPTKEWQGKSGLGDYGDYVMETDWAIGQVLEALDKSGAAGNTLVFVSSDNGAAPYVGAGPEQLKHLAEKGFDPARDENGGMQHFKELEALGHFSSGDFRGHKSDIWEGGHRVPTFVRWQGKVQPGSSSDQLVSLVDLMATCADILRIKLPPDSAEDSQSMLPVLLGQTNQPTRESVVFHSISGMFAIQQGKWKLELCSGSGGWGYPRSAKDAPAVQLYDMSKDIGERTNEQAAHPDIVDRLTKLLGQYVSDGRSTPGPPQHNDVPITLWKEKTGKGENSKKP